MRRLPTGVDEAERSFTEGGIERPSVRAKRDREALEWVDKWGETNEYLKYTHKEPGDTGDGGFFTIVLFSNVWFRCLFYIFLVDF